MAAQNEESIFDFQGWKNDCRLYAISSDMLDELFYALEMVVEDLDPLDEAKDRAPHQDDTEAASARKLRSVMATIDPQKR